MNLDERLEALTQTVELIANMQLANEKRIAEGFAQTTRNFEIVLDSIKRLENIALAHEERHDDTEQRLSRLEKRKH